MKFYIFSFIFYNNNGDYMKKKIYLLSFIFFIIDLISKICITNTKLSMPYKIIKNFFYIDRVTNTGGAFSLFMGETVLLIIVAILVLIYIDRRVIDDIKTKLECIGISMTIGGILGNLLDRVIYGKITDFLSFKFWSYNFPVFNLADTFICMGILLLLIEYLRTYKRGEKNGN